VKEENVTRNKREQRKIIRRKSYLKNKEKIKIYNSKYSKEKKEYFKNYYKINKEKLLTYKKVYEKNNKNKINIRKNKYRIKKYKEDLKYKLLNNLRRRILIALKNNIKSNSTMNLLGCSIKELWIHLEKSFKPGMTKENHGKWHIDHIRPCASFDLNKPEEQSKCFHYTNLQALWAHENLSKGSKYVA
jgi:hypothetical protein